MQLIKFAVQVAGIIHLYIYFILHRMPWRRSSSNKKYYELPFEGAGGGGGGGPAGIQLLRTP